MTDTRPVKEALEAYFRAYGIDRGGYAVSTFRVPLGPLVLTFPNPGRLAQHDLHHVALGLPATFWGEVEISAFELRTGVPNLVIGVLCVGALLLGGVVAPRRVWRAWRRHPRGTSLYPRRSEQSALLAMSVSERRASMQIDRDALAPERVE